MSLSALGLFGLFLKPIRERVTANAKDALDPTHARTFIVSGYDLLFLCFTVASTWIENTPFATIFAPDLLTAASIVTIFDDI